MIWFTSDLHFGHEGVIRYCNRPFANLDEMHAALIKRWNERVRPDDTVYVIGDLALCHFSVFAPLAAQLNGTKILIQGNHDHYSVGQYRKLGFTVYREVTMKLAGKIVRLSHYPYALPWYKRLLAFKSELRFMDRRPPRIPGEILIHGHTHMKYQSAGNRIHVGVDAWNFYPASLSQIERLINLIGQRK